VTPLINLSPLVPTVAPQVEFVAAFPMTPVAILDPKIPKTLQFASVKQGLHHVAISDNAHK